MNIPEIIEIGKKYLVVDVEGFGYSPAEDHIMQGDKLEVVKNVNESDSWLCKNLSRKVDPEKRLYIYADDLEDGAVEYLEDTQECNTQMSKGGLVATEFKAGQRWRVVNADKFNTLMPAGYSKVRNGDLLVAVEPHSDFEDGAFAWEFDVVQTGETTVANTLDISGKTIVLSEDTQEYDIQVYEDGSWGPSTRVSISEDGLVTTKQNYVDSFVCPTEVLGDYPLMWTSSVPEEVETHAQESTDGSNSKDILWHIISRAERYNGHSQFTVSDMDLDILMRLTRMLDDYVEEFCELRLSWAGDHLGYYTAVIYEIASIHDGAEDKILMQVGRVTGI